MNQLAIELNEIIKKSNPHVYDMLSQAGKSLFFPKGILTQSAEAKEKAHKFNATIGMAREKGKTMFLPAVMDQIGGISPDDSLTYAPSYGVMGLRKAWNQKMSTYFVEDGDFVRIQNIQLAYNLNGLSIAGRELPDLRVYITADRPVTLFSYNGFSPEVPDGIDTQTYPVPATYMVGLNVRF